MIRRQGRTGKGGWQIKSRRNQNGDLLTLAQLDGRSQLRGQVERALECLKQNGTLAALHEKWFGVAPEADSSTVKVYPGSGTPGFAGYDEAAAPGECK